MSGRENWLEKHEADSSEVVRAVETWLFHAGEELAIAKKLVKHGVLVQAADHSQHGAAATKRLTRLLEMFQPGFIRTETLLARRLRRSQQERETYMETVVKRFDTSERLLREVGALRKPQR